MFTHRDECVCNYTLHLISTVPDCNSRLLVDKLKALGVPPGPVYSQLKRGEVVTTEDGRTISPAEVVSPQRPGRKLVLLGDTADSTAIVALAMGADVVVHEATNECAHEEKARANGHSTPGLCVVCQYSCGKVFNTHTCKGGGGVMQAYGRDEYMNSLSRVGTFCPTHSLLEFHSFFY